MEKVANVMLLLAGVILASAIIISVYFDLTGKTAFIIPLMQIGLAVAAAISITGIILWKKDNN